MAKTKPATGGSTSTPSRPRRAGKPKTVTTPATQLDVPAPDPPPVFDLVGADGRRLARSWSRDACKELQARVADQTGEKTRIVSASPFASAPAEP